ncbi:type III secretion system export apparatus subunit SctU [Sodalis sp. dw_96]|uniref:type III secretion system export apparatus subunit SctU n=1 Tax=Sodalis sp. dw_96 TaxID=2719794 RepID=UPI001BD649F9|nr:type III secretion system export apparatus subunit SctU [Sodalis sp. dw_96]
MSEKTEDATPQKLKESRKKGQVSQSQDIPRLLICIGIFESIFAMVDTGMQRLESMIILPLDRLHDPFAHAMDEVVTDSLLVMLMFCGSVCGIALLLRIVGGWVQFGPLFAPEALAPKFDMFNPAHQFKNMFSTKQFVQLLASLLKAAAISTVFYLAIKPELGNLAQLAYGDLNGFWQSVMRLFVKITRQTLMVLLVISLLDFAIQKFFFRKQQRMSHEDIRNEFKQSEGDPHMKGHRRQVAKEILNKAAPAPRKIVIKDVDMLLVNPTHYAVGLFYRPDVTPLPRLMFKAADREASELIERAQQARVPVIRFVWLTRTLYRTTREGAYIPRETLTAVAQVYRLLRELEDQQLDEVIEINE